MSNCVGKNAKIFSCLMIVGFTVCTGCSVWGYVFVWSNNETVVILCGISFSNVLCFIAGLKSYLL